MIENRILIYRLKGWFFRPKSRQEGIRMKHENFMKLCARKVATYEIIQH